VRIEFHRPGAPDDVVGHAVWSGSHARISADHDGEREAIGVVFRPTPVVTDDPAYRRQGTRGEVVIQPGSLSWFRAAAFARAEEVGLVARAVPGVRDGGWDPAAQYRRFGEVVERLELGSPDPDDDV
jgi:hypothetical protein